MIIPAINKNTMKLMPKTIMMAMTFRVSMRCLFYCIYHEQSRFVTGALGLLKHREDENVSPLFRLDVETFLDLVFPFAKEAVIVGSNLDPPELLMIVKDTHLSVTGTLFFLISEKCPGEMPSLETRIFELI